MKQEDIMKLEAAIAADYAVGKISMKQQTVIFHKLPEGGSQ